MSSTKKEGKRSIERSKSDVVYMNSDSRPEGCERILSQTKSFGDIVSLNKKYENNDGERLP
eukprot:UN08634